MIRAVPADITRELADLKLQVVCLADELEDAYELLELVEWVEIVY